MCMRMTARKPPEEHLKTGRPTKYKPGYCELARKLCLLTITDEQLAMYMEVDVSTLGVWKNKYPEFQEAINNGRHLADKEIAEALAHRAKGYSHPETKVFCNSDGDITTCEVTKHYPPDTAAAFIWLKNRAGWKDKKEIEGVVAVKHVATDEEVKALFKEAGNAGDGIPIN